MKEKHVPHLQKMFGTCTRDNLKLKLSKCNFVKEKIHFLEYEASNHNITPDNSNTGTIKKLQCPISVKELQ